MRSVTGSVLLVAVLCAGTTNCASEISTEEPGALGQASVPLTAMGASGALYRLTGATFTIAGPTSSTISTDALPDSGTIDVALNAGAYQITLQPGWVLERTLLGMTQAVEALLASTNPMSFAISDQVVTPVSFVFQVDGDVIPMGQGVLRLGIAVEETGPCMSNAECAPDEFCNLTTGECVPAECVADADCGAGNWCFTSLSFGNFCVATGSGGLGAPCDGTQYLQLRGPSRLHPDRGWAHLPRVLHRGRADVRRGRDVRGVPDAGRQPVRRRRLHHAVRCVNRGRLR